MFFCSIDRLLFYGLSWICQGEQGDVGEPGPKAEDPSVKIPPEEIQGIKGISSFYGTHALFIRFIIS